MMESKKLIEKRLSIVLDFLLATSTQKGLEDSIENGAIVAPILVDDDRDFSAETFKLSLLAATREKRPMAVYLGVRRNKEKSAIIKRASHTFSLGKFPAR